MMLEKGADRTIVNKEGQSPYQLAKTVEAAAALQELCAPFVDPYCSHLA